MSDGWDGVSTNEEQKLHPPIPMSPPPTTQQQNHEIEPGNRNTDNPRHVCSLQIIQLCRRWRVETCRVYFRAGSGEGACADGEIVNCCPVCGRSYVLDWVAAIAEAVEGLEGGEVVGVGEVVDLMK